MEKKITVILHNDVQSEVYNFLKDKGYICEKRNTLKKESSENISEIILLPFPTNDKTVSEVFGDKFPYEMVLPEQQLVGGMFSENIKSELEKRGIKYRDYFADEAYVIKNAFITSQGAMRLLYESTDDFLVGKTVLVTGFGRIGKSLSLMLKSAGLKVFVGVRSKEKACEASALGFDTLNMGGVKGAIFYFDFIFNTVPSQIFDEKDVSRLKSSTIYFELASSPFGADKMHFENYGKNHVQASALPGKFYPKAVAKNICDFICYAERGNNCGKN